MFEGSNPAFAILLGLAFLGVAAYVIWRARQKATAVESQGWLADPLASGPVEHAGGVKTSLAPTQEEMAKIEELRGKGLSLDDACRLAHRGFSWLEDREKAAYQAAVQRLLGIS